MQPLSIYVHIPFCQVKCPYCDFYSVANADATIAAYMDTLQEEIQYYADRVSREFTVATIFFGGGTPSYVPAKAIEKTLQNLAGRFTLQPDAEITLEMNPASCETAKLSDYRRMGINRISMGVQSFDDAELRFLGRAHCAQDAHAAVASVRRAGYENFNLDFIFAIPGQTLQGWTGTLKEALRYDPVHVSAYNLTYEDPTPLARLKRDGAVRPTPDGLELAMYRHAIASLQASGLAHYEISNFARAGKEAKHNLAYWNAQDYLGLGAGAHSFLQGRRFSKKRSLKNYLATTSRDRVESIPDEDLSAQRRFWELLAIGLRNLRGVRIKDLARRCGYSFTQEVMSRLNPWIRNGFLECADGTVKLTEKGLLYYDRVASALIEPAPSPILSQHNTSPVPR